MDTSKKSFLIALICLLGFLTIVKSEICPLSPVVLSPIVSVRIEHPTSLLICKPTFFRTAPIRTSNVLFTMWKLLIALPASRSRSGQLNYTLEVPARATLTVF